MLEVENDILEKAQKGNNEAMTHIFNSYRGFIFLKSKSFFINGADKDDVCQEGMVGLLKAIRNYDKEKVASFKSFASLCIQRQIITAVKKANAQKHLAANRAVESGEFKELEESFNITFKGLSSYLNDNPETICMTKDDVGSLTQFLSKNLSSFEKTIFRYLISGYDYRDVSKSMKKSLKAIDNGIQRIRRKSISWLKSRKV